jgi:intracellular septation protein A
MTILGTTAPPLALPEPFAALRAHLPASGLAHRPCLKALLRRLTMNLSIACVIPAALFYVTLVAFDITFAVLTALAWSYGAVTWRWATKRAPSSLLALTVAVMSVRTAFVLATGNTFIYFFQPILANAVVALIFLLSLATARPVVARMASDFYPMDHDLAARPRIRRLFSRLTVMWAAVCVVKGLVSFWLLQSQSLANFVMIKNIAILAMTVVAIAISVWASVVVARKEGLLAPA